MNEQLEMKMREIIWRRWTTGEYSVEESHPSIFSIEIYNELIESGISVPSGAMEQIFKLWMSQGYIRTRAVGGNSEDKRQHGSMYIFMVYESLIKPH